MKDITKALAAGALVTCIGGGGGGGKMAPTMSKREAEYRIPAKTEEPCRICDMFHQGRCDLVKGDISSDGTCKHFVHAEK